MKSVFTAGAKSLVFGFAIVVFFTLNQQVARADTVIHGLSVGAFNGSIFGSNNTSLFGLTFTGTSFPNPVAVADTSVPSFSLLASSYTLGSFTLTGAPATYTGNTFTLQLTFSYSNAPNLDIIGGSQPSFPSSLIGTVQSSADGSVTIDFNNAPSVFTVTVDGIVVSTFRLVVDDITLQPGQTVNIEATVVPSEVPEPATLLMLSAGLAGLGTAVRKRRKTSLPTS